MLAEQVDYVIGVDTHRDQHALAVVAASTGVVLGQRSVRADARGYREALRFAARYAVGARVWAVEGAGHYGAGLARALGQRGERVLEVGRGVRAERRLRGKDDPLDAVRAARTALAAEAPTLPRAGQRQEALRVLLLARRSARRRSSSRARPAAQRDRHRTREPASGAAAAAGGSVAPPLQPLPPLERTHA